jgi:hypothetical protein
MLDSRQGSDMTLPSGAIGVFNVAPDWTMGRSHTSPVCDMETWMVMELMDRGTLAAMVRSGAFIHPMTRAINMVSLYCVEFLQKWPADTGPAISGDG